MSSISVVAAGAGSGDAAGSKVTGTIPVKPYQQLYVQVGGAGGSPQPTSSGSATSKGGYNGGGPSGGSTVTTAGYGGGGASDVQTTPTGYGSRLIVAGGAGGAGGIGEYKSGIGEYDGGSGGYSHGTSDGADGGSPSSSALGGGGGQAATSNAGGVGGQAGGASYGAPGTCPDTANAECVGWVGHPGQLGQGGAPGLVWGGPSTGGPGAGGGGGGGYYGGGAGGSGGFSGIANDYTAAGGGGGGGLGSSLVPPGGTLALGAYAGNGTVTITVNVSKAKETLKKAALDAAESNYRNALAGCAPLLGFARLFTVGFKPVSKAEQIEADECARRAEMDYEIARASIDPADPNFLSLAVPQAARPVALGGGCQKVSAAKRAACRAAATIAARLDDATATVTSIWATVGTSLNRLNTATADASGPGETLQSAALEVYDGELIAADKALDSADRAWANELIRAHAQRVIPAAAVAAESKQLLAGTFPPAVARQLRANGIAPAQIASVFAQAFGLIQPTSINVISALRSTTAAGSDLSAIRQDYHSLSTSDLKALIAGLAHGRSISHAQATKLSTALSKALQAKGSGRKRAVTTYERDISRLSQGVQLLLQTASKRVLG